MSTMEDRMAKMRAAKAAKAQRGEEFVPGAAVDLGVPDSASALYKDKSGAKRGGGLTEGQANFGAVTQGAIQSVKDHEDQIAKEAIKAALAEQNAG